MKIISKHFVVIGLLILAVFATSCDIFTPSNEVFKGGEILNAEKMSEIKAEIFGSADETTDSVIETTSNDSSKSENSEVEQPSEVYWTSGGSVWHLYEDCGHLKRGKDIISGTVQEAIDAGKEKVCSSCDKKAD